jgi:hypothetical protein
MTPVRGVPIFGTILVGLTLSLGAGCVTHRPASCDSGDCAPRPPTFCDSVRARGGTCDSHHLVTAHAGAVHHTIESDPDNSAVFLYLRRLNRIRVVGRTPFYLVLPRATSEDMLYCAGECGDLSHYVPAKPVDMTVVFRSTPSGWVSRVEAGTP